MSTAAQYRGTGKRKTSIARVILRPGDGATWINGRTIEEYFPRATHRTALMAPLGLTICGSASRAEARPDRPRRSVMGSRGRSSRPIRSFGRY